MQGNKKASPSSRDVISKLPDDVLCKTLSFLTTKEAALTQVMSKRWSNLLQLIPILDFDDSLLLNPKMDDAQIEVFKEFVDRVLSRRDKNSSPVQKVSFRLTHSRVECFCVLRWMQEVINLGAMDLELSLRLDHRTCMLFYLALESKKLVNLRIGSRICIYQPLPYAVCPRLSSLVLDSVEFVNAKLGLKPILSVFPNLQSLRVHESEGWYYWNGSVSSPTLKTFVYRRDDDTSDPKPCTLYYRGGEIPEFNNLISLSLGSDRPHGTPYIFWKLLPSLLLKSRNLQTLIIKGLVHYVKKGWEVRWLRRISWDDVSDALSSSGVKVLEINGYEGTGEELSHMERFLGKLSHLEMVRVTHKGVDDRERFGLVNDLLLLPRTSPKCKVQVMKERA